MKKNILLIISSLISIFILVFTLLFTPVGNTVLRPFIETKINEHTPFHLHLKDFSLNTDSIRLLFQVDKENSLLIEGNYGLFTQSFELKYDIQFNNLNTFNTLTEEGLSGELLSDGTIIGNLDTFKIKGKSNIAKSATQYVILINENTLEKAAIRLSHLHLDTLLTMLNKKPYAKGNINLHLQLNDLNPNSLKGSVKLVFEDTILNAKAIKKDFDVSIHKTKVEGYLRARLENTKIDYIAKLDSALANINSKGELHTDNNVISSVYDLDIKELAMLETLTHTHLRGPFSTRGELKGTTQKLNISGKSDIANSNTRYNIELVNFKPSTAKINIDNAALAQIFYMLYQPEYAMAKLNADIDLKALNELKKSHGTIDLSLTHGLTNTKLIQRHLKKKIKKSKFNLVSKTKINKQKADYNIVLKSDLANFQSKGKIDISKQYIDADFDTSIKTLSSLNSLINQSLHGSLSAQGNIKGDNDRLQLDGTANIAGGKASYIMKLNKLKPETLSFKFDKTKLEKLTYLIDLPSYANGTLNLDISLSSLNPMQGVLSLDIPQSTLNRTVIKQEFDTQLPYTRLTLQSKGKVENDRLILSSSIDSNLASITAKQSKYDLKKERLDSDFSLYFPDLQRLEKILDRRLYGSISMKGKLTYDTFLRLNAESKAFSGKTSLTLNDTDLKLDFTGLHAKEILHMLGYPKIIDAPINGSLTYNTQTKKGDLHTTFENATLEQSQMTRLIKGLTSTDLSKERFNQGSLDSIISNDLVDSKLKMKSSRVNIQSKKFLLNTKKQLIDARFNVAVKKYQADVLVTQSLQSPKVRLDAQSMITPEVKKKVNKEINRLLKRLF